MDSSPFLRCFPPGCNHKHSPSERHGAHRGNVSVVVIMCKACHEGPLACLFCHLTAANVMMIIAFTGKKASYQKWFQNFPWGLLSSEEKQIAGAQSSGSRLVSFLCLCLHLHLLGP